MRAAKLLSRMQISSTKRLYISNYYANINQHNANNIDIKE